MDFTHKYLDNLPCDTWHLIQQTPKNIGLAGIAYATAKQRVEHLLKKNDTDAA